MPPDVLAPLIAYVMAALRQEVDAAVRDALAYELPRAIRAGTRAEYLTREQAAEYIGRSLRSLDGLRSSGRIAWSKRGGRVMIATADLDAYLNAGRVPAKRGGAA